MAFLGFAVQGVALGTAVYFTIAVQNKINQQLNSPFTLDGLVASVGNKTLILGPSMWISVGATGAMMIAFGFYFFTTCCSKDRRKYRESVYY